MNTIAIIDDREDVREELQTRVLLELKKIGVDWDVISVKPFEKLEEYLTWVQEKDIVLLLVDENLNERPIKDDQFVGYNGHNLVAHLRQTQKELPIFIITANSGDDALENNAGDFEDVIDREVFVKNSSQYLKRFLRATNKFLELKEEEFKKLSELSRKVALGEVNEEELKELEALQTKLEIPFSGQVYSSREEVIKDFEKQIKDLDKVVNDIQKFLRKESNT